MNTTPNMSKIATEEQRHKVTKQLYPLMEDIAAAWILKDIKNQSSNWWLIGYLQNWVLFIVLNLEHHERMFGAREIGAWQSGHDLKFITGTHSYWGNDVWVSISVSVPSYRYVAKVVGVSVPPITAPHSIGICIADISFEYRSRTCSKERSILFRVIADRVLAEFDIIFCFKFTTPRKNVGAHRKWAFQSSYDEPIANLTITAIC